MRSITTQIPASTSNLGPGFDCLGIALSIYNRVTVARADHSDAETLAEDSEAHPMAREIAAAFWQESRQTPFPFRWQIEGDVPMSRGLGSSVTLRLGLLHGLNGLAGRPLSRPRLFELCAALEGHPDNAAPAQFGGFTVSASAPGNSRPDGASAHGENVTALRFPVSPALKFVLLIPDFEVRTVDARRLLPASVPRLDAVASSGRACRITAAFASRKYALLRGAFEDSAFHQPYRLPLVPFLPDVLAAGRAAGALGGFLSGSGSTIACLTLHEADRVGEAMRVASGQTGARVLVTTADGRGARRTTR